MDEPKRGTVIHIGDTDIFTWTQNNPHIIFPELIVAAEELLYKDKDEIKKLGGRWDGRKKSWYFTYTNSTTSQADKFQKWIVMDV